MQLKKTAIIAAALIGGGLLAGCDGTDLNPNSTVINIGTTGGSGGGTTGGGTTGGTTGGSTDPNVAPAGALSGSIGTGVGTLFVGPGLADPFSIASLFSIVGFNNGTSVVGRIDNTGYPVTGTTGLTAAFNAPSVWPPATATDAVSLPVPSTVVSTNYIGAFDPAVTRPNAWTAGWTVRVNGNQDVWRFFGGAAGTALAAASVPQANGTCPAGTTLVGDFNTVVGPLANDEAALFTGTVATSGNYDVCRLPARFGSAGTLQLTNDNVYEIEADSFPGTVIGNGDLARGAVGYAETASTLAIEPGTIVYASGRSALVISRGAQIVANGTAAAPIVLTSRTQLVNRFDGNSATPVDAPAGGWAGLALLGLAPDSQCAGSPPTNFDTCDVLIEGNVGRYGGNDSNDSSGSLRYVVVRSTGSIIAEGNELQGITAGGVGRSTVIDYVQVHRSNDDGIEFFGGNAFATHMVFTGAQDDSIDIDNGWTGGIQFALVIQENDLPNSGFELDGRFARTPTTFPLFANITVLGPSARPLPATGDRLGLLAREGMRLSLNNTIITGDFPFGCIDIDDNDGTNLVENTFGRVTEAGGSSTTGGPHLLFRNVIADCNAVNFRENDENPPV
jgi:hypothetical protein